MKRTAILVFVFLVLVLLASSYFAGRHAADWWQQHSSRVTTVASNLTLPQGFSQLSIPPPQNVPCVFAIGDRVDIFIEDNGKDVPLLIDCLITKGPKPITIIIPADARNVLPLTQFLRTGQYSLRKTVSSQPPEILRTSTAPPKN